MLGAQVGIATTATDQATFEDQLHRSPSIGGTDARVDRSLLAETAEVLEAECAESDAEAVSDLQPGHGSGSRDGPEEHAHRDGRIESEEDRRDDRRRAGDHDRRAAAPGDLVRADVAPWDGDSIQGHVPRINPVPMKVSRRPFVMSSCAKRSRSWTWQTGGRS